MRADLPAARRAGYTGTRGHDHHADQVTPLHWLLLLASLVSTGLLVVATVGLLLR